MQGIEPDGYNTNRSKSIADGTKNAEMYERKVVLRSE